MIVAFIGENGYAREQAAAEYIANFVAVNGSTAVDRFEADNIEYSKLTDSFSTIPFLSPRRLIVIRDLSVNKEIVNDFEKIINNLADTNDLVIIENHIDSRSKYFSNLKKLAEVKEYAQLEGAELIEWAISYTDSLGGVIDRQTAFALIDRVGTNHQLIVNELQKLVLYDLHVTRESVNSLTAFNPQSSIFNMLDSAFNGDISQALILYAEQRAQGMEPQALLGMIVWQLYVLSLVKSAGNELPPNEIASQAKISPFVVRKNLTICRRLSTTKIVNLLELTIKTDRKLKTTNTNPDSAVQSLITAFA